MKRGYVWGKATNGEKSHVKKSHTRKYLPMKNKYT